MVRQMLTEPQAPACGSVHSTGGPTGCHEATLDPSGGFAPAVRTSDMFGVSHQYTVHTIEVVSDGRYVHAYPVEDEPS